MVHEKRGREGLKKMGGPLVSIVIAAHNEEKTIKRAILSALNQTYTNLQVIVVDDASTDNTYQIARKIAEKDERVILLRSFEKLGPAYSRNKGIKRAEGKYIGILDADDWYHLQKIRHQISFLERRPSYGILGTFCITIQPNGKILKTKLPLTHDEIVRTMAYRNPFVHSSVVIRRDILEEVGYYDPNYKRAHDYDLYFRIISRSKGANLPEYLCYRAEKTQSKKTMIESTLNSIIIPLRYWRVLKLNVIYYPILIRRVATLVILMFGREKH